MSKPTTPCHICGKKFINLSIHHTKMHAVFTIVTDGNIGKIMKDGVCFTTLQMWVGNSSNDEKGGYNLSETCLDENYKAGDDGKTYRYYEYDNGGTELWLTSLARGNGYLGGKSITMITNKIISVNVAPKPRRILKTRR
jgi:hypothetical protein